MDITYSNTEKGIRPHELEQLVEATITQSCAPSARSILIIPPDITRMHSHAGPITDQLIAHLRTRVAAILPAIGTHAPMTELEIDRMYPGSPKSLFKVHDWRHDVEELGQIPEAKVAALSGGKISYSYPIQANKLLSSGQIDCIISVGQVVPHEVAGMANHAKTSCRHWRQRSDR